MKAAVAFYGSQPKTEDVPKIKGAVMLQYAGLDKRINAGIDVDKAALEKAQKEFEVFPYEGVNQAFHKTQTRRDLTKKPRNIPGGEQ